VLLIFNQAFFKLKLRKKKKEEEEGGGGGGGTNNPLKLLSHC
jgi:hypothetical protein